ncbi:ribosomal RNA small subunit methyltransferase C [Streptosporangium jomthongense]|uniref:Ribosomal RNA small subunit methyltransferase C n=1 Tax=Marinobacter aromaticivorans TaxID=1494078 RepID=A0ABW2IS06_9GAMM|nr:class I SAM-dependent methyltransferase [Marinobacter aromaticivorans]GGE58773.1 ribosomal RNA small subunit methyltransferase C [Streptosporangium jomthongense]
MSGLPNSHQALLKNRHLLSDRVALLGVASVHLLPELPGGGLAMSEHAGVFRTLEQCEGWQACFGYDAPLLAENRYDTIVVFLPKARAELEMRLALARSLASDKARLILIGEKKEGIAGAIKQLKAIAPQAVKKDSARHCQVWCAEATEPAPGFRVQDWLSWRTVECAGVSVEVAGLPGIFSQDGLDRGTHLLLETLAEQPVRAARVLDFACGAGVIGAWIQAWQASRQAAVARVDGVDVQSQAVICARETYQCNATRGTIFASDGLTNIDGVWQGVISNPPFHTGVKTDTSMTEQFLQGVKRHLQPGGELRLVANSFLPYEPLISRYIGRVERLREDGGFTVYRAFRGPK